MLWIRPRLRAALFFSSLLLVSNGWADDAASETWEVILSGDTAFGSIHTSRQSLPDGNQRIVEESRYLIDLFGQRQELRERRELTVTSELVPVECRSQSFGNASPTSTSGQVVDGQLLLTIERNSAKLERKLSLNSRPFFATFIPEFLANRPAGTDQVDFDVIDVESWKISPLSANRLPPVAGLQTWSVSNRGGQGGNLWTIGADGHRSETSIADQARSIRRATADEAAAIVHLVYAPRELLVFPIKLNIPFPERSKQIRVQLSWKKTPFESMQLEDSRQHIARQSHAGDAHQIELRLEQPAPIAKAPSLPVIEPDLSAYLQEDEFIRPNDPAIQARAKEWAGHPTTTLDAVRSLSHQVSEFMQGGEMIAETLSGPEVLACRKGKCTEYTTLLASLARALGVPTRVALGMRLVAGQWMGHMWCEVWVGQWIPVDASVDEVGGSPALLKLTHSDTVGGTQKVRWEMTKSLDVEVLDFEPGEKTNLGLKTGILRQTYTDADFACRVTAPDGWTLHDQSKPGTPMIQFKPPAAAEVGEPMIHFVAFALPSKMDPAILVNARKGRFASSYADFEVLQDEAMTVPGLSARRFCFRQENPAQPDKKIKTTEIIWTNDRSGYLVNLIADESVHDKLVAEFERIATSFESLTAAAEPTRP